MPPAFIFVLCCTDYTNTSDHKLEPVFLEAAIKEKPNSIGI